MRRVLVVSRDLNLQNALAGIPDIAITVDATTHRAEEIVSCGNCDVVVLDLDAHPAVRLLDFSNELRSLGIPVVLVTGDEPAGKEEIARRGVEGYCRKPLVASQLNLLESAIRQVEEDVSGRQCSLGCGGLIGWSTASRNVYDMIRRVAPLDVFVIVTGENGTGKELIARAIHSLGDRASRPFVAVSCGAIPESLIEAELFGCEKGAFTGANARRSGYFEEARDGTLLLDEIGELSLHTQTRLLRVLQEREFARLGSSAPVPLRARLLFATNRNLRQMVEAGSFREDLYYRLNVVGIHSTPLRERPDDIPLLAQHFLDRYSQTYRKEAVRIDQSALQILCRYDWPGNVRELENAIQHALILCEDDVIVPSNLPEPTRQSVPDALTSGPHQQAMLAASFEDRVRDFRTHLVREALRECKGNKTLAAQRLSISRTYLHRLIREPVEEDAPCSV